MATLKKVLVIVTVLGTIAGTSNLALAHCGSCGIGGKDEHKHEHGKDVCVKCTHEKACAVEDCEHEAHQAECICPKQKEEH